MTKSIAVIFLTIFTLFNLSSCSKNENKPTQTTITPTPIVQKTIQPAPGEIAVLAVNLQKDAPIMEKDILSGEDNILVINTVNTDNKDVKLKDLATISSFGTVAKLDENSNGRIDPQANTFHFLYLLTLAQNGQDYKIKSLKDAGIVAINVNKDVATNSQSTNSTENVYKIILANGSTRTIQMIATNNPLLKSLRVYFPEE